MSARGDRNVIGAAQYHKSGASNGSADVETFLKRVADRLRDGQPSHECERSLDPLAFNGREDVASIAFGLEPSEEVAMALHALRLAGWPALISLLVTIVRFFAERSGVPNPVTFWIGITWVAVATGIYYGFRLVSEERPYALLCLSMVFLGWLSRVPAVILWWITKTYGLGTHYDVFSSWGEALSLQLGLGP
ncbi:MAG TPA: hypothetical protein VEK15_30500, partial [Vicinamibacteria bacterium]|nr:hypothetical protein [Vicinamibacteria bacterium]